MTELETSDGGGTSAGPGQSGDVRPYGSRLLGPLDQGPRPLRARIQSLATVGIVVANLGGAVVVIVLNAWVLPRPEALESSMVLANVIAVPVYLASALVIGVTWGTRLALAHVRWALDDRQPGDGEQRAALRVPMRLVGVQAALWAGAVVVFSVLTLAIQPRLVFNVGLSVGLGGVVTCAAAYLLAEFVMRPVAARALFDPPDDLLVPGVKARWLLAWGLGSGVPVVGLMLVAVFALVRDDASSTQLSITILALGGTTIVVGLLLAWLAARATVDPILSLRSAVQRVERGDLGTEIVVYDGSEIGLLQASFNRMVVGLRERDRIRDLFGRHVGEDVAREALAREVELGGEVREAAMLFVDIVGSTEMAAHRPPAEVVALLNRFFAVVVDVVDEHGGAINKFEGDAALAVFGVPVELEDHAGAALRAARELCRRLGDEVPDCAAGVGVAAGHVVAGNVGDERRFEYTVIGDPVNEAARLCDHSKVVNGRLVASMTTVEMAGEEERGHWAAGDAVQLRGRREPTRLALPR